MQQNALQSLGSVTLSNPAITWYGFFIFSTDGWPKHLTLKMLICPKRSHFAFHHSFGRKPSKWHWILTGVCPDMTNFRSMGNSFKRRSSRHNPYLVREIRDNQNWQWSAVTTLYFETKVYRTKGIQIRVCAFFSPYFPLLWPEWTFSSSY